MSAKGWETAPPAPLLVDAVTNLAHLLWHDQFAGKSLHPFRQQAPSTDAGSAERVSNATDGMPGHLLLSQNGFPQSLMSLPLLSPPGCLPRKRHHGQGNMYLHHAA